MNTTVVTIPTSRILDWMSFHAVFEEVLVSALLRRQHECLDRLLDLRR